MGVSSNYARFILPDVLKEFSEKYSNIQFKVFTGWSDEVLKEIEQDKASGNRSSFLSIGVVLKL
ncbi:hypothetical protein ACRC6Q_09280 [Planococcus sp. SE5232]|uniref:hypothetical protein n=1 Tax=unclassified Planococcus (in: firmicutes) TaxID=2662419 RepID=UPI003D6BA8C3